MSADQTYTTILGIDPGFDRVGWAIAEVKDGKLDAYGKIELGCIETSKKLNLFDRYQNLKQHLIQIIKQHQPQTLAIETLFFSKNKKTALKVAEARGIIISTCLEQGLKIFEYNPNQIKQVATGSGRADKKAVEKMIRMHFKLDPKEKIIDDAIDALAIILTHQVIGKNKKFYA